jgi:hypothetical protein
MRYLVLVIVILLAIAGYTAFWFHIRSEAEANVTAWVQERRDSGDTIQYAALDFGGYPFRIEATATKPVFGRTSGSRAWTVEGESLRVAAAPWNLGHIVAYHEGPFAIHYRSTANDGRERMIDLTGMSEAAGASAVWKGGAWDHADLELAGVDLTARTAEAPLSAGHLEFHVRKMHPETPEEAGGIDQPARTEYALEASDVSFPGAVDQPLGKDLQTFEAILEVHGDKPLGRTIPEIEAWRDAGGTVDVKTFTVDWGPLKMKLDGSLALDEANRPVGALTANFSNYDKLIDALAGPTKNSGDAGLRKFLGGLVRASGQPTGDLSLPFSIQDGTLYLGPVAVANVPPLIGPSAPPQPPARN